MGLAGAGGALVTLVGFLLVAAPTPRDATVFGIALTVSLALATFLVSLFPQNPLLARLALVLGAMLVYPVARPDGLAVLRLKHTLRDPSVALRAAAATRLVQRGSFDLSGVDLSRARLVEANLAEADLSGAKLSGADLTDASLAEAKVVGTDLRDTKLGGADLSLCDLGKALGLESAHCDSSTILPGGWTCRVDRVARGAR
jgi:hypothetical protein